MFYQPSHPTVHTQCSFFIGYIPLQDKRSNTGSIHYSEVHSTDPEYTGIENI